MKSDRAPFGGRMIPKIAAAGVFLSAFLAVESFAQAAGGGFGMMGGSFGYGMMGGAGYGSSQLSDRQATTLLEDTATSATVNKSANRVTFTGRRIKIAIAAVQPGYQDTTFEVAGLVDPTIVVPAGSTVTLELINMDYGDNMNHGVAVVLDGPPYPAPDMMAMRDAIAVIPPLVPRSAENVSDSRYPEQSATFDAPAPGTYFYICQYYDHASRGMYGRFVVSSN